jgi:plastocyanin
MKRMPFALAMFVLFIQPYPVEGRGPHGTLRPALADDRSEEKPGREITIHLKEYTFEPGQVTFKRGEKVKLTLENRGTVMHEFLTDAFKNMTLDVEVNGVITEAHGVSEFEIPAGAKVVLLFTPEEKGVYSVVCEAKEPKDHLKEGMSGELFFH